MRQPMATELIQLAVGNHAAIDRGRHNGLPIRDVVAPSLDTLLSDKLALETEHIDWMENWVGKYPFDVYGSFVVDSLLGFALETQSLSCGSTRATRAGTSSCSRPRTASSRRTPASPTSPS